MSAFLIKSKRILGVSLGTICVCFTLFSFFYAGILVNVEAVQTGREFYFLVSKSAHVEVSAHIARLQGGAGYSLSCNRGAYAAYAVYFSLEESANALQTLQDSETEAQIIEVNANPLYTKGGNTQKEEIKGAFNCLYAYMQILQSEISRLEKGATQESSKRILSALERQFDYLAKNTLTSISGFSNVCKNAQTCLLEWINDVVYVKDLRYLLCELSVAYVDLSRNFEL